MKIFVKKATGELIELSSEGNESMWDLSRRFEELGISMNIEGMNLIENGRLFEYLVPKNLIPLDSVRCAVPGCQSNKRDDQNKVFFQFPTDQIRCHQWVLYCQRFETDPGKKRLTLTYQSTICGDHFRPDQFVKNTNTLLKRTAVPCVPDSEWKTSNNNTADIGLLNISTHQALCDQNLDSCFRLCRLCANICSDFFLIFDELGRNMKLSEKINLCFPFEVKPSDPLPKQICRSCFDQLEELFSMADLCSITQQKLIDTFSSDDYNNIVPSSCTNSLSKCPLCDIGDISFVNLMPENLFDNDQDKIILSPQFSSFDNMVDTALIKNEPGDKTLSSNGLSNDLFAENNTNYETDLALKDLENNWSSCPMNVLTISTNSSDKFVSDTFVPEVQDFSNNINQQNYCSNVSSDIVCFSCRICGSEYKEREDLLKHSFDHSCKAFYQCAACVAFFIDLNEFELHTLLHKQEKYSCNICQKQYNSIISLNTHLCKPTKCPVCLKIFANDFIYSNHMKSHQSSSYCRICCKVFTDELKLQKHYLYVHNSKRNHCCEECGKVFKSEASMRYHQRIHQNNEKSKPYTCEGCGKNFLRRSMLVNHMTSIHQRSPLRVECFTCKMCNEAFPSTRAALSHFENNHESVNLTESTFCFEMSEVDKIFVCEFCQRLYSSEYAVNLHREQHPPECPYECKHCGLNFISLNNFNIHQNVHSEGNMIIAYATDFMIAKSYLCEFCERCFINYTKYKEHLSIHYGPEPYECRHHCSSKFYTLTEAVEHRLQNGLSSSSLDVIDTFRPYQCHFCNKAFSIEDALIKHIRMHTGEKPFICDQCGKGFSQSSGLYTHQKVHSSDRPYSCTLCTRTFKIKGDRDVHLRKHSGDRPYKCEFCGKAFMTQHVYSQHRKIHTGERPYRCDVCGLAFRRSHVLTVHKRIHTGEKPNICVYCGKRYRQKGDMLKHCRVQHGISSSKQSATFIDRKSFIQ